MKNLKKLLGLMIISVAFVAAIGTSNAAQEDKVASVSIDGEASENYTAEQFAALFTAESGAITKAEKSVVINILEDTELTKEFNVNVPVTINLYDKSADEAHTLTINMTSVTTAPFTIGSKGSLTINGEGELKVTAMNSKTTLVSVAAGGKFTTSGALTIDAGDGVDVVSVAGSTSSKNIPVVEFSNETVVESAKDGVVIASGNATVNMAGSWDIKGTLVKTGAGVKGKASTVTINKGTYETEKTGIAIEGYSKVTIMDGADLTSQEDAVLMSGIGEFIMKGGSLTSEGSNKYALKATVNDEAATISISGGELTSGGDEPALNITQKVYEASAGLITGGTFNNGLTTDITGEKGGVLSADTVIKALTGNSEYTANEDGTVVVKATNTDTPGTTEPGEEQKPGDNEPEENPKTFDAIGSLVAMAVSSLGVVGTATKKYIR